MLRSEQLQKEIKQVESAINKCQDSEILLNLICELDTLKNIAKGYTI